MNDYTPLEFFRVLFIQDFLTAMGIYAVCWPLGAHKLIGWFLNKAR